MPSGTKPSGLTAFSGAIDRTNDLALIWDNSASLLKRMSWSSLKRGVYDVVEYGADASGASASTTAINAASAAAYAAGGGTVYFPPGTYEAEGLKLYPGVTLVGSGLTWGAISKGTLLQLPAEPSTHLFAPATADFSGDLVGGGICNMGVDGQQSTPSEATYDFINLEAYNEEGESREIQQFLVDNCYIENFRHGYYNPTALTDMRDRTPHFSRTRFYNMYSGIWTNEHPKFSGWNEFYFCTFGITGNIYDVRLENAVFGYCGDGMIASAGNNFERNLITNCVFGYCLRGLTSANTMNIVNACQFHAGDGITYTSQYGVKIGGVSTVSSCNFHEENATTYAYSVSAVVLDNSSARYNTQIIGNEARLRGTFISLAGTADIQRNRINNNSLYFETGSGKVMNLNAAAALYLQFNDNTVEAVAAAPGADVDLVSIAHASNSGVMCANNTIIGAATNVRDAIRVNAVNGGLVIGNCVRQTTGITLTNADANTVPNASRSEFPLTSNTASDAATLKSMNVIRT